MPSAASSKWRRRPASLPVTMYANAGCNMKALCALALILVCGFANAHSGGKDAQGCHTNRKTGDYHCHGSKGASVGAAPRQAAPAQPSEQTCYVGPRGGTYTITKNGKKNYAGC